jgi:hypothetical protein
LRGDIIRQVEDHKFVTAEVVLAEFGEGGHSPELTEVMHGEIGFREGEGEVGRIET